MLLHNNKLSIVFWYDLATYCVAITVVLKCAPECIKMQHFEGENTKKKFSGEGAHCLECISSFNIHLSYTTDGGLTYNWSHFRHNCTRSISMSSTATVTAAATAADTTAGIMSISAISYFS